MDDPYEDWQDRSYYKAQYENLLRSRHMDNEQNRCLGSAYVTVGTEGVRRKTLEFEVFRFTYDYISEHLYVEEILPDDKKNQAPRQIRMTRDEVKELRLALDALVPNPDKINYRGTVPRD